MRVIKDNLYHENKQKPLDLKVYEPMTSAAHRCYSHTDNYLYGAIRPSESCISSCVYAIISKGHSELLLPNIQKISVKLLL